jgi:hypothetical protein
MKRAHTLIIIFIIMICGIVIPPAGFSTTTSELDQECEECHSEFEAFEIIIDAPTEVPRNFEFDYKVIVRNNGEHEVQDLEALIDLSEAAFLDTTMNSGEPYNDEISSSVSAGQTATIVFPVINGSGYDSNRAKWGFQVLCQFRS